MKFLRRRGRILLQQDAFFRLRDGCGRNKKSVVYWRKQFEICVLSWMGSCNLLEMKSAWSWIESSVSFFVLKTEEKIITQCAGLTNAAWRRRI